MAVGSFMYVMARPHRSMHAVYLYETMLASS